MRLIDLIASLYAKQSVFWSKKGVTNPLLQNPLVIPIFMNINEIAPKQNIFIKGVVKMTSHP